MCRIFKTDKAIRFNRLTAYLCGINTHMFNNFTYGNLLITCLNLSASFDNISQSGLALRPWQH
jgi:hypothetical protein